MVSYAKKMVFLPQKYIGVKKLCVAIRKICWKCGNLVKNIVCEKCNVLQKPNKHDHYFNLLGVSCSYKINISELTSKYHKLQTILHPDKFTSKTEEEKAISEEYSSLINKAYSTLLNPMDRGIYMLRLSGKCIEEDAMSSDAMLLMKVMELNEELESIYNAEEMNRFSVKIENMLNPLIMSISEAFENKNVDEASKLLTEMKYYVSVKERLKERKQTLNLPD